MMTGYSVRRVHDRGQPSLCRETGRTVPTPASGWGRIMLVVLAVALMLMVAVPAFAQTPAAPVAPATPTVAAPSAPGVGDAVDRALGQLGGQQTNGTGPLAASLRR